MASPGGCQRSFRWDIGRTRRIANVATARGATILQSVITILGRTGGATMSLARTVDRRCFLQSAGATLAAAGALSSSGSLAADKTKMKKAVKWGMIQEDGSVLDKFKLLKELGFDGVELDAPSSLDKTEVLRAREETGLPIHGVVDSVHWRDTL